MQGHTMTLQDQEFELIRTIRNISESQEAQDAMIEDLIREIETIFAETSRPKPVKWLQIGKRTEIRSLLSVTPNPGAPLASDIITQQRARCVRGAV